MQSAAASIVNIETRINATCPACGLLCDDIAISVDDQGQLQQTSAANCAKSITFFSQQLNDASAKILGESVPLAQAIAQAAAILKAAKKPLFAGLSTDLAGFRAAYQTAEKTQASMMHMNASSSLRNIKVLQSKGWQTTTLTEVKNRADMLVFIGTDAVTYNPCFFERVVWVKDALFTDAQARDIVYFGGENLATQHGVSPDNKPPQVLPCADQDIPELIAALRALVLGKTLKTSHVAGIAITDLIQLAERLKSAKYAVLIWNAKEFDFPHAELAIQNITETVVALNEKTRAAALAIGGSDGDTTANYAHTWLNGLTLQQHDVNAHDALVWINSFSPKKLPPTTDQPLIVIGNANTVFQREPDVFIPVATPGLDVAGTLFRVDGSVVLPLKKLRTTTLPTLAEVLMQIEAELATTKGLVKTESLA